MTSIEKYFNAERTESIVFILVGVIAMAIAIYFFVKLRQPYYSGIAYALIVIALIQLTVGSFIYIRSPKDIEATNHMILNEPSKIQTEEIPRMEMVIKNFILYRWIEIGLILMGLFLFFSFSDKSIWKGLGLGLIIQSGIMLVLDYFAESRGKEYLEYLQGLNFN